MVARRRRYAAIGTAGVLVVAAVYLALRHFMVSPDFLLQSRLLKTMSDLRELVAAEEEYFKDHSRYLAADPYPAEPPSRTGHRWRDGEGHGSNGFEGLGWEPTEPVYCRFGVAVTESSFTAVAECDGIEEGQKRYVGYVKASKGQLGVEGPFGRCKPWGVVATKSGRWCVVNEIGPCDRASVTSRSIASGPDHPDSRRCDSLKW